MHTRTEGFALLAVLALLAVVGLYTMGTLQDAQFASVLSGTRVVQQRAFLLADLGLEHAMRDLAASAGPLEYMQQLHPLPGAHDDVTIQLRATGSQQLATGFSANRLVARHYQITSTGRSARGASSVQVQGVVRVEPLAGAAP
jgi:Tfp pilus assembly protein PilX